MSKKRIHIDEFFRRGLGNMQLPVSGSDWGDMQAMIAAAQKRRRRTVLWWWFTGVFLVLGTGALVSYNYTNNVAKSTVATSVTAPSTQPLQNKTNTKNGQNQNINSPQQNTTDLQNNTGGNTPLKVEKSTTPTSVSPTIKTSPKNNTKQTPEQPKQNRETQKSKSNPGPGLDNPDNLQAQTFVEGDKTHPLEETNSPEKKPDPPLTPETPIVPAIADNGTKADSTPTPTKGGKRNNDKGDKPRKTGFNGISFLMGPAINKFGISNTTNYGRIRNAGDRPGIGLQALVAGDYEWKKFTFSSGIGFTSIGGGGRYNYKRQIWDSVPVFNGPVIIGYFYKNYRDTSLNYTLNNRFNYLTLPVQASYLVYEGKKSGFVIGMGVQLQYLLTAQGEYINPDNLFKFDLSKTPGFVKKWNFGGNIRLGYYYTISDKFALNLGLNYTRASRMLNKNIDVGIRPRSIGLEMGIKYNLVKN